MKTRTRQELFDLAWNGLKAQGFQRALKGSYCAYRGDGGCKCAIGHCIPDDDYRPDFEGFTVKDYKEDSEARELCRAAGISASTAPFAAELQSCHDAGASPANMRWRLQDLADKHRLTVPS